MNTNTIYTGDAFEVLPELPAENVHAVVTDPPYGLAFMGRDWDDFSPAEYQEWCEQWANEVKRVLKPGGHLLAFSGNRTHHRLFTGVEDAGFEIRDTITWHYGSGFPKALDVSKAIDKAAGAEREVVGEKTTPDGKPYSERKKQFQTSGSNEGYKRPSDDNPRNELTAPATEAAKKWNGWKTALKPATEFVVVARKPLSEGTVAENVQTHGTGALNIDGTRIDHDGDGLDGGATNAESAANFKGGWHRDWMDDDEHVKEYAKEMKSKVEHAEEHGRYPANVVFDEQAAEQLDSSNEHTEGGRAGNAYEWKGSHAMSDGMSGGASSYGDHGGPSRYFYTSKATRAERTLDGKIDNAHPTVKPVDLMEWLVVLATAEEQIVLDPFAGSGTTLRAAKTKNRRFIGIEKQPKWADVARARIGLSPNDPNHVRDDDAQTGFETFVGPE